MENIHKNKKTIYQRCEWFGSDNFNAGRNLAIWDYRSCPVDFEVERRCFSSSLSNRPVQKPVSVIGTDNLLDGVFGNPPNLMNAVKGKVEYRQLSLFDCTYN